MKIPLRLFAAVSVIVLLISFAYFIFTPQKVSSQSKPGGTDRVPKYIFLFLADGAGIAHLEITRQYNQEVLREGDGDH